MLAETSHRGSASVMFRQASFAAGSLQVEPRLYSRQVKAVHPEGTGAATGAGGWLPRVLATARRWGYYPYWLPVEGQTDEPGRRDTAFRRLATVHGLSSAGDALVAIALAGSVFFDVSARAAESRVALSLGLTVAPFLVVGPLLGPLVERARGGRRAIVVGSAIGRAICCFLMAYWVHSLALFPVALFTLIFSKLYMVTKAALVPGAVSAPGQLVLANSKLSVGGSAAGIARVTALRHRRVPGLCLGCNPSEERQCAATTRRSRPWDSDGVSVGITRVGATGVGPAGTGIGSNLWPGQPEGGRGITPRRAATCCRRDRRTAFFDRVRHLPARVHFQAWLGSAHLVRARSRREPAR